MAKYWGISPNRLQKRLKKLPLELALTLSSQYGIPSRDHTGRDFPTLTAMAEAWGVRPSTVSLRLDRGWSVEDALTIGNCRSGIGYLHHKKEKERRDKGSGV